MEAGYAPFVAVLATLDTKAGEARYLREVLTGLGDRVRVVDIGLRPTELDDPEEDVGALVVASAAGATLADLREHTRRDRAMAEMAAGAGLLLRGWVSAGQLLGALAVGGNQGRPSPPPRCAHCPTGSRRSSSRPSPPATCEATSATATSL
jgi:uncharacterized protein (UPF0261 family)